MKLLLTRELKSELRVVETEEKGSFASFNSTRQDLNNSIPQLRKTHSHVRRFESL